MARRARGGWRPASSVAAFLFFGVAERLLGMRPGQPAGVAFTHLLAAAGTWMQGTPSPYGAALAGFNYQAARRLLLVRARPAAGPAPSVLAARKGSGGWALGRSRRFGCWLQPLWAWCVQQAVSLAYCIWLERRRQAPAADTILSRILVPGIKPLPNRRMGPRHSASMWPPWADATP